MASSSKISHAASVSNTGAPAELPADALFEVLLRLPAKDLCRLRAVCHSWRALTYDPHFAAVHTSRHAEPLFAVTFRDGDGDNRGVAIVDLSGQVLRQIPFGTEHIELLLFTDLDRLFVIRDCKPSSGAWILNPATGVAIALPGLQSEEYMGTCNKRGSLVAHYCKTVTYAFGHVASTDEYKVLRICHPDRSQSHLCDIITLDSRSEGRWRRKENPPSGLKKRGIIECLAVNGIVYFLFDCAVMERSSIAPFNLEMEKWMPNLRGPEPLRSAESRLQEVHGRRLSLANLNGSLVIVETDVCVSYDLWFLMDHKSGFWVKKYSLSILQGYCFYRPPVLILDDGRIVIYEWIDMLLQCYDPTTNSLTDVLDINAMGLGDAESIGVYTGSLLI